VNGGQDCREQDHGDEREADQENNHLRTSAGLI
jgi:hypothetical protein